MSTSTVLYLLFIKSRSNVRWFNLENYHNIPSKQTSNQLDIKRNIIFWTSSIKLRWRHFHSTQYNRIFRFYWNSEWEPITLCLANELNFEQEKIHRVTNTTSIIQCVTASRVRSCVCVRMFSFTLLQSVIKRMFER